MKFRELNSHVDKFMTMGNGNQWKKEMNALVIEGPSGIGKTSALYARVTDNMKKIVASEAKFKNASDNEITTEAKRRIIFVPIGTADDIVMFFGMAAVVKGELQYLRPKKLGILWDEPETPKVLILDELNRVDDIKLLNGIQTFLDRGDRHRIGIENCVVFGSQNPSDDVNYSGTEEADLAMEYRIIKKTMTVDVDDICMIGEMRKWSTFVLDAVNFLYLDDDSSKAVHSPRLLEMGSEMIDLGMTEVEDLFAAVKDRQLAGYIHKAIKGDLFKILDLNELKTIKKNDNVGISQILASFRRILNEHAGKARKGDKTSRKVIEDLGNVMLNIPAVAMASIHTRFGSRRILAEIWAKNTQLAKRVNKVSTGEV